MRNPHQREASGGAKKHYPTSIPESRHCGNPHILQYEKYILCRLMLHGKKYKHRFTDERHEIIYIHLEHLQKQIFQPTLTQLLEYLAEYKLLDKAGGSKYIKNIFRGLL